MWYKKSKKKSSGCISNFHILPLVFLQRSGAGVLRKSAAASPTKRMKRILVAESEQVVNKKAFAIDTVVGDCSATNHRGEHQQRLE